MMELRDPMTNAGILKYFERPEADCLYVVWWIPSPQSILNYDPEPQIHSEPLIYKPTMKRTRDFLEFQLHQ